MKLLLRLTIFLGVLNTVLVPIGVVDGVPLWITGMSAFAAISCAASVWLQAQIAQF